MTTSQTNERIPTLAEMGGTQLYPEDPTVGMFTDLSRACQLNATL